MSDAVDPVAAVRGVLLDADGVAALVGEGVYSGELPGSVSKDMPLAAIVVKAAGGPGSPGGGYQDYGKTRIDLICYGDSIRAATAVYLAAYPVLKDLQRVVSEGVLLHGAEVSSKGATARDPVKQWPTNYSSWLVLASEIAAP